MGRGRIWKRPRSLEEIKVVADWPVMAIGSCVTRYRQQWRQNVYLFVCLLAELETHDAAKSQLLRLPG